MAKIVVHLPACVMLKNTAESKSPTSSPPRPSSTMSHLSLLVAFTLVAELQKKVHFGVTLSVRCEKSGVCPREFDWCAVV